MNILAITLESWQLAGVSVGVVFVILVALVYILEIFTLVAKKSESRASAVKKTSTQNAQEKSLADASEKDKARRLAGPHRVWCSLEERRSHHDHRVEALPQGPHPVLPAASSVRITPSLHRGTFAAPPPPLELQARIGTGTPLESA